MTRHRVFGEVDKEELLNAMRTFRDALIRAQRTAPPTGEFYNAVEPALGAVDASRG